MMKSFFKAPLDIEILLDNEDSRKHVHGNLPLYEDGESINGIVTLRVREGKRVEHLGVKISVIGSIDVVKKADNGTNEILSKKPLDQFLCLSYDLCPTGELQHSQSYSFAFKDLNKRFESYVGRNVEVNYYVKVTVLRKSTDISKIKKFWVYLYKDNVSAITTVSNSLSTQQQQPTAISNGENAGPAEENGQSTNNHNKVADPQAKQIKLDIGIENCLHIEFEYSKAQYSLKDVIVGRIYFLLTRLKIRHMELSLLTREISGMKPNTTIKDTITIRYEIMDGSPVKGETIPIRLFLGGYDLTPNMSCNYFSVKNYLSLVIVDEDGRRYFKQSEVILYRTRE
ncbi:retromer subunit PEP8 NDAI_0G05830 [Naumovozyma dairenensis CBS 421]|uniref:Vacuolar protein sorting-associated protein 26 n=1 Tax=Naumovozyma dairenensis (strain ATCC 10597 / BCRC 20456 / CBS 421 / NBRC 0211 / NRRL Y-12639) TaxID=1071378 RepID=J7S4P4_NAUDC|nr:hypothetical protein NDAI_0G05830 [Naumovozyma dairenensis CBS 421]CCK73566.1 hypothetical protein NDAI_0G05830 [Naumovozyma dairenensis CBS 421]